MISLTIPPTPAKLPLPSLSPSSVHYSRHCQTPSSSSSSAAAVVPPPSSTSFKPNNNKYGLDALKDRFTRHLDGGRLHEAFSTLGLMSRRRNHPDLLISYSLLLKSCIRSHDFQLGKLVHDHLTRSGLEPDSVVLNSLISLYSKCGDWGRAHEIFESMGDKRDLVSWSALISCYANNGLEFDALIAFLDFLEFGFYPNEYSYSAVIRACSNQENYPLGEIFFGSVIKTGYFESDACVGCALIDMFVKGRSDSESAFKVFDKMPERNVVTWTLMITRLQQLGCSRDAVDLFFDMIISGYEPDGFTLSGVVSACAELGSLSLGQQLHSLIMRMGLAADVCVGCSLIDMYAKCAVDGSVNDSRQVFDGMPAHNVMSWTAIITAHVQSGACDRDAIELFCNMIRGPVKPNHFTFSSILKACANLADKRMGQQVYAYAVKMGLASVNCVGNSLISLYAQCGDMEDARKAFDAMFEKNLVSYNTIVYVYAKSSRAEEAFELFHEFENAETGADAFTFASLLSGASSIGAIGNGQQIHARVLKSDLNSNLYISNALISMYSRCGDIDAAFQVFKQMGDHNVISWTSMITGFAKHGFAARALETFQKMLEADVRPNEITNESTYSIAL